MVARIAIITMLTEWMFGPFGTSRILKVPKLVEPVLLDRICIDGWLRRLSLSRWWVSGGKRHKSVAHDHPVTVVMLEFPLASHS